MKLLFYIQSMIAGGAQRVVATLSNYWAARGMEVVIVTLAEKDTDFYTLDARVRRLRLDEVRSENSSSGVLANINRIRRLRTLLRREQAHVAVAMMETASVVLALAGLGSRTVLIGSERIHPPFSEIPAHWHNARNLGYRYLDAVVAQTSVTADWLRTRTRARELRVIPNPIELPLDRHEPLVMPPAASQDQRLVLGLGRLVPQKNFLALIDAFAIVARELPQWDLAIVGEGVERPTLSARIAAHQLVGRVSLPGKAGNAGDWYKRANLFAMTSHYEGFPNTLLEALAHGVPAVSFDCEAGPRDLLRHGVDGLLVRPGDVRALADSLRKLMTDDEMRSSFALAASEAQARYAVSAVAGAWEALFAMLMARRSGAR